MTTATNTKRQGPRNIGTDNASLTAEPNKFRAVIWMHSEPYKVGDDWPTKEEAMIAISLEAENLRTHFGIQIYDDKCNPLVNNDGTWRE